MLFLTESIFTISEHSAQAERKIRGCTDQHVKPTERSKLSNLWRNLAICVHRSQWTISKLRAFSRVRLSTFQKRLSTEMLRRKNNEALPTVLPLSPPGRQNSQGFLSNYQSNGQDGSGRSIKMDAPIVKSWKKASIFTKYSYYALGFFLLLLFIGYRYLRYRNGKKLVTFLCSDDTLFVFNVFFFRCNSFYLVDMSSTRVYTRDYSTWL